MFYFEKDVLSIVWKKKKKTNLPSEQVIDKAKVSKYWNPQDF